MSQLNQNNTRDFIMNNIYSNPDDPYLESKNFILLLVIAGLSATLLGFGVRTKDNSGRTKLTIYYYNK